MKIFRKTQISYLSGRHAKVYLLLGVFPLIVFILLFAKLNFKRSVIVDEEVLFSVINAETLESAFMANIRVDRRETAKPRDMHKRLRGLADKPESESKRLKELVTQGNTDERLKEPEKQGTTNARLKESERQGTTNARLKKSETQGTTNESLKEPERQGTTNESLKESERQGTTKARLKESETQCTTNARLNKSETQGTTNESLKESERQGTTNARLKESETQGTTNKTQKDLFQKPETPSKSQLNITSPWPEENIILKISKNDTKNYSDKEPLRSRIQLYRNNKRPTVFIDTKAKSYTTQSHELHTRKQIDKTMKLQDTLNKHQTTRTKLRRKTTNVSDSDQGRLIVGKQHLKNGRVHMTNETTQLKRSKIYNGQSVGPDTSTTFNSYVKGQLNDKSVSGKKKTEITIKVEGQDIRGTTTTETLFNGGGILKNNGSVDTENIIVHKTNDRYNKPSKKRMPTNILSRDRSKGIDTTPSHKKEILKIPSGPFIEISEKLQCNETTKKIIMALLPLKYKHSNENMDRVVLQMNHIPNSYKKLTAGKETKPKVIYWYGNVKNWFIPEGKSFFEQCNVKNCIATYDKNIASTADAVIFGNPAQLPMRPPFKKQSRDQIWAISMIETPPHSRSLNAYRGLFNWTLSYRQDSVVATPYFKFRYFSNSPKQSQTPQRNYAEGKTKKVAMFVSNCFLVSSNRMIYAKTLANHIDVDIFGRCGKYRCSRKNESKCMEMLKRDYKFYLSFENSKCEDYMTEKVSKAYE